MFIQGKTLATALSALAFLSHAIPSNAVGFGRPAHGVHHARSVKAASNEQAFAKRSSDISAQDVQQLQSEYTAFHGWVNTWLQTALQEDAATAVAQLKQEFTAYDSWMNTWLDSALNGASSGAGSNSSQPSAPAATILSSAPLPQSTSIASSEGLASPVGSTRSRASAAPYPTASMSQGEPGPTGTGRPSHSHRSGRGTRIHTATVASGAKPSHSHHSGKGTRIHTATVASGAKPHTASSGVAPIGTASTGKAPVDTTPTISATALSTASSKAAGGSSSASASGPSSSPSSHAGSGSFNAKAKDNVAVYYGQSAATTQVKLTDLCSDKDVDIVIMAFLTTFAGPGGYPSVNFGGACSGSASPAMTAKGATGLLSCPDLGTQIKTCQSAGKKVMLSLGGADASSAFTSDDQATKFATQLWNLFGAGTGEDAGLRPFGAGVTVDGFDIDNENKQPAHYDTFVTALRSTFKGDSSKSYYISAAPQCPSPDASIPLDAMKQMDFVWVQFYNNGNCNVGASGFVDSFKTWSSQLSGGPMLYIGAPACGGTACAGSGYVAPAQMGDVIKSAMSSGATNMGGVMLWDGAEGYVNKDGSGNYMSVVKSAMD